MTASVAEAEALLRAGKVGQAAGALRSLVEANPGDAAAQELLATALERSGDGVSSEAAFRAALVAEPGRASAATRLASRLAATHRAVEAIELLRPFVAETNDPQLLTTYGAALKSEGRYDEAVVVYARAQSASPDSGVAWHNLGGALGDAQRYQESLGALDNAFARGVDSPATWLIKGRSLSGLDRFDEAETAFRAAIRRHPAYTDAHLELAQLIWMRTADAGAATADLDQVLRAQPGAIALILAKTAVLEYAVGETAAYAFLSNVAAQRPHDAEVQTKAAHLTLAFDPDLALKHARRAVAVAPREGGPQTVLCQASLAAGHPEDAARLAEDLRLVWPNDQHPITLAATAWRVLEDARYHALFDYNRLVRPYQIETPSGWPSLEAYLSDLAASLRALHGLRAHPVGQSLRQGTQSLQSLTHSEARSIKAFFDAIDGPIRAYIEHLAKTDDVLGRRARDRYRFGGAWSVLLQPGGHHVNHIHQLGWISSAFHVELPRSVEDEHQGWLKFGEPGTPTSPPLGPEHFVKPVPGTLVLFPSYMWHGTVPFGGGQSRLTVAFDVLPA